MFGRVGLCLSFVGCVWLFWVALCRVWLFLIVVGCFALFDLVLFFVLSVVVSNCFRVSRSLNCFVCSSCVWSFRLCWIVWNYFMLFSNCSSSFETV